MNSEMKEKGLSNIAVRGTGWYFLSFFSGKLLSFLSTVILARLLLKDDFGLVAYALTFITFLEVVNSFGIDLSLVYHKESEAASNASFWLTLGIGLILFLVTLVSAPIVGSFFRDARVVPMVRVLGLTFPLQALGGTHSFLLQKKLAFGLKFVPDFTKSITKAAISITFAYLGYGSWSLIWGQVGGTALAVLALWIIFPWRPAFLFDTVAARSLLSYGTKIMSVDIVSIFASNIDYLFVGRYLGSEVLGVYTLAFRLPELLIGGFARIIGNVIFPIFTHIKNTTGDLSRGVYETTKYVALITLPLGVGLALVARPFTIVVFTEKWIDLFPIMQALAIFAMINTIAYNIGTFFKAIGFPQIITWLEVARLLLLVPSFAWAVLEVRSVILVAWVHAFVSLLLSIVTVYIAVRRSDITWGGYIRAVMLPALALVPMTLTVLTVMKLTQEMSPWVQLINSILSGAMAYLLILWVFQKELILDVFRRLMKAIAR